MNKRYREYDPDNNMILLNGIKHAQTLEEFIDEESKQLRTWIFRAIKKNESDLKKIQLMDIIKLNRQKLIEYREKVVMIKKCIAVQLNPNYSDSVFDSYDKSLIYLYLVFGSCDESLDSLSQTLYWIESKPFLVT